ncbi:MAG: hypothetical protein A2136_10795 [Chloroflexi bacterium RBG_16_54_11]|nr:MAG: hypothetical protein A2136_10795 [Chloroflexi bacterium RBG_16_54_11]
MQPKRKILTLWKLVQRENAARYMLISLLSSVATVTVVRSFLALTGYPQIGSGTLHIAHVLWGGLVLYIAAILPLIYINPHLHNVGAILSGVGVGMFINEVGKFITREYDYFFPAAAPIMYVFFLLVVILVIMINRPEEVDGRSELVQALEIVREQLYRPLDVGERVRIEKDISKVLESDPIPLHVDMARHLLEFVRADARIVPESTPAWWVRIALGLQAWLSEWRLMFLLAIGMPLLSLLTLKNPLQALLEKSFPDSGFIFFLRTHLGRQIEAADAPMLFNIRLGLEVMVGVLLLVATILLIMGKRKWGINLGFFCLLVSLAVLDMLLFYFEQFSSVLNVGYQLILLIGLMYYRSKYIKKAISF